MCDVLTADKFLALLLTHRSRISFHDLRILKHAIENTNPQIIVDISAPAVKRTLMYYPHVFSQNGSFIVRTPDADTRRQEEYFTNEFLGEIPPSVCEKVEHALASV